MKPSNDAEQGAMTRSGNPYDRHSEQWLRVHGATSISAQRAAELLMPYLAKGEFRHWQSLEYVMYSFGFIRAFHVSDPKKPHYYHRDRLRGSSTGCKPAMMSKELIEIERRMHGDWL